MRWLLPNYQFEDELVNPSNVPRQATLETLEDLSCAMLVLASDGDTLLLPSERRPGGLPQALPDVRFISQRNAHVNGPLVPWGWSERCRKFQLTEAVRQISIPSIDSVARVNGREFLMPLDRVWDEASGFRPGVFSVFCHSRTEWSDAVGRLAGSGVTRWCTKSMWSNAGRNRLIGVGTELNAQQRGWLAKHLREGVSVEPWVGVDEEWSLQFDISASRESEITLLGVTRLLNDQMGRYAGNLVLPTKDLGLPAEVLNAAIEVAEACREADYWGPLGLDGFRFRDENGNSGIRICNDINARHTMGRLALACRRLFKPEERGLWCQIRLRGRDERKQSVEISDPSETARKLLATYSVEGVRITRLSPSMMGERPVRTVTLLLTGETAGNLMRAQQLLSEHLS